MLPLVLSLLKSQLNMHRPVEFHAVVANRFTELRKGQHDGAIPVVVVEHLNGQHVGAIPVVLVAHLNKTPTQAPAPSRGLSRPPPRFPSPLRPALRRGPVCEGLE